MTQVAEAGNLVDVADRGVLAQESVEAHQGRSIGIPGLLRLLGVLLRQKLGDRTAVFNAIGSNDLLEKQLGIVVHLRPAPSSWCLHRGKPTPLRELPARQT